MPYTITYRDATGVRTDLGRVFDDCTEACEVAGGMALAAHLDCAVCSDIRVCETDEWDDVLARNHGMWLALGGERDDCHLFDPRRPRVRTHCPN